MNATGTITHNNGIGVNDTLVSITYTSVAATNSVSVTASNGCGNSAPTFLAVLPNSVSGTNMITAQLGGLKVCPGDVYTYSAKKVPNATSYLWTVNSGTISHNNGEGVNDTLVTVTYTSIIAVRDTIRVRAVNACGASLPTMLVLTPNTPSLHK